MAYEVRRRRGQFVEKLPGPPVFETEAEAKAWASENAALFPTGVTAIELVKLRDGPNAARS